MRVKMEIENFSQYEPGHSLRRAFAKDKVPLLQMEHLRQLDFMISRGLSYENTVNTFMQQLFFNESLWPLKVRKDMVILLDTAGALICAGGVWSLLFAPEKLERITLAENADLYPVYSDVIDKVNDDTMCDIFLPVTSERVLLSGADPFCILDAYAEHYKGGYLAMAKKLVIEGTDELYRNVPVLRCGALTTVDVSEIENYNTIRSLLEDYIFQFDHRDGNSLQPLSVAVFGAPGSGKSFGIREIARSVKRFRCATLNCSQFGSPESLFEALHQELSEKSDAIPLIFFDEFDSAIDGQELGWLRYFLAPMQDGEYTLHGRTETIDAAVFVFAGGTADTYEQFLPDSGREESFRQRKGPDFVSRLKGTLNIMGPNPNRITDRRHLIRRALLLRDLIIRKFPDVYDQKSGTVNISPALLSSLLRVSEYRHGTRSLEFILAMSRLGGEKRFTPAYLPPLSQLNIHLDVQDFQNKIMFEQLIGDGMETFTRRLYENAMPLIDYASLPDEAEEDSPEQKSEKKKSESKAGGKGPGWDLIGEINREYYRSIIRYLFEKLQDPHRSLGVRRMIPDAPDTVARPGKEDLETLSRWTHEAYVKTHLENGWCYDAHSDQELLRSKYLVSYDDLPETRKAGIRSSLADHARYIRSLGFELFHRPYDFAPGAIPIAAKSQNEASAQEESEEAGNC